jgi:nucleotide-binding universal stress UspA family protein
MNTKGRRLMNTRFLLGIHETNSPTKQHLLRIVSEFLELFSQHLSLFLRNAHPRPLRSFLYPEKREGSIRLLPPTIEQRERAERTLCMAQKALLQRGFAPENLMVLLRIGVPADQIVKAAGELQVDCIVIESRGNDFGQRVRRLLVGSTSRRVLHLAPCPVMVVSPLQLDRSCDLIAWYEAAVKHLLEEHPDTYTILTQTEVAHLFVPPTCSVVGRRELGAASCALERPGSVRACSFAMT